MTANSWTDDMQTQRIAGKRTKRFPERKNMERTQGIPWFSTPLIKDNYWQTSAFLDTPHYIQLEIYLRPSSPERRITNSIPEGHMFDYFYIYLLVYLFVVCGEGHRHVNGRSVGSLEESIFSRGHVGAGDQTDQQTWQPEPLSTDPFHQPFHAKPRSEIHYQVRRPKWDSFGHERGPVNYIIGCSMSQLI